MLCVAPHGKFNRFLPIDEPCLCHCQRYGKNSRRGVNAVANFVCSEPGDTDSITFGRAPPSRAMQGLWNDALEVSELRERRNSMADLFPTANTPRAKNGFLPEET